MHPIIKKIGMGVLASVLLSVCAHTYADLSDDTPLDNFSQSDQSAMPPPKMQGQQGEPLAPTGAYFTSDVPSQDGIPQDNTLNSSDGGDSSGYPLPLQSTGSYPAGMQPGQDIQIPGTSPNAAPAAAIAPLTVHVQTHFTGTMAEDVDLVYQYFYTDVSRVPWKGYAHLRNHSDDQSV
ncbi:MAG TPA: hypothetical protein VI522_05180, partial [Gammaproteobacteria bacterium]|nr:hypothetical protein [Gammaproteobacteria bacterium]